MFARQLHYHHLQAASRECQTSEEDESRSTGGASGATITKKIKLADGNSADGATIEVVRRPRGRPPGSKNKPKPPIVITHDTECAMRPHVFEVPGGLDVVDSIALFARRRNIGLCVLTGSGAVANVTLRQPSTTTTPGATVTFHGRFDILSISATFIPPSSSSSPIPSSANGCSISLVSPQGQILGGSVAGSLLAAGTVVLVAASITNPSYHRLPLEEDQLLNSNTGNAAHSPSELDGDGGHPPPAESCGMSIYNCHLPSDVIWTPAAARQQLPPSPF
ncbi:hypothetical protein HHK36_003924 [Tetracentron sinense]|uniref:PPC domain-containing protein n=1 Tax=Tetracentron sinense TaxID=13715 RepID=A0A834ZTC1_TETSI|nr:hypothetical protein HHK36_003924 [Tetracentron sinense]